MVRLGRAAITDNFRRQVEGDARAAVKALRQRQQRAYTRLGRFPCGHAGAETFPAPQELFNMNVLIHAFRIAGKGKALVCPRLRF
jgi:hypothetical protein